VIVIEAGDATTLFRMACHKLVADGVTYRRGGALMRELPGPVCAVLTDPRRNMVLHPVRQLNPWVTLAEFPWMMAGRRDIGWLLPYMPRAMDYSDDGATWRAAYGPRLRRWDRGPDAEPLDQLGHLAGLLIGEPNTRRAVATIWDPTLDTEPGSKDYPCTNWMQFLVNPESGALDMTVVMRSNDLWWGWSGVNVMNFTLLHQLMAGVTSLELGTYRHISGNLHIYPRHQQEAEALVDNDKPFNPTLEDPGLTHTGSLADFTEQCGHAMGWVRGQRDQVWLDAGGYTRDDVAQAIGLDADNWLVHWAHFMDRHRALVHVPRLAAEQILQGVEFMAWRLAAIRWISHLKKTKGGQEANA